MASKLLYYKEKKNPNIILIFYTKKTIYYKKYKKIMKKIYDAIFRLYLYADTCKIIHYTCEKNHTHELSDEVRDSIIDFADKLAEQFFGYNGKPKRSELTIKLDVKEEDYLEDICKDVMDVVEPLRNEFNKNPKLSDLVSLIDDFKGKMKQNIFLTTFDHLS